MKSNAAKYRGRCMESPGALAILFATKVDKDNLGRRAVSRSRLRFDRRTKDWNEAGAVLVANFRWAHLAQGPRWRCHRNPAPDDT